MKFLLKLAFFILFTIGITNAATVKVPNTMNNVKLSFSPIVKQASPAVVNIYAQKLVKTRSSFGLFKDPFFKQFFGDQFSFPQERVENSLGSGVIVNKAGWIVTNNHVIGGASKIKVVLSDRREYSADIVLSDAKFDLAILKLKNINEDLPVIKFSDSNLLDVGDLVLAIGNPFGVGQTVTIGIVSALARSMGVRNGGSNFQSFIQTDAAINPGNSGGALIDINGELIGVNTAIFSKSGGSNGIGFAIPANIVKIVVKTAIAGKNKVIRPWFGISGKVINYEEAKALGLAKPFGILVEEIHNASPAKKVGIKIGDIITKFNNHIIYDYGNFNFYMNSTEIDEVVNIAYIQNGKQKIASFKMQSAPEVPLRNLKSINFGALQGLDIVNLSPLINYEFNFNTNLTGVAVTKVDNRYSIAKFIKKGDIILGIGKKVIKNTDDLIRVLRMQQVFGDLTIIRNGKKLIFRYR